MSLYVQVRDKKRNIIRQITRHAYQSMTNRYELLDGEPVVQQKKTEEKRVAAPAVEVKNPQIEVVETKNEIIATPKKRGPKPKTV